MKAEPLGEATYKITLDSSEAAAVPPDGKPCEMRRFIRSVIDRLTEEQGITLPDGRLLVEAFLRSDGSCVFFVSALENEKPQHRVQYYSCELQGTETLLPLIKALSDNGEKYSLFCGSDPRFYRIIFSDPSEDTERICSEFGEYCEISPLFAAQTREYLTEIISDSSEALSDFFD